MPPVQGRKRRAEPDDDESAASASPKPATQRRRITHDDDDDAVDASFGGDNGFTQADTNTDALVKKMVRLALACEYQRRPIRRADISEKVLAGTTGRNKFRDVFNQAQIQLRAVFGMEMVELPAREKATMTLQQQRKLASQKGQQSQVQKGPGSWILVSVLPREMREGVSGGDRGQEEDKVYVGIYTVLVSLIALSGGSLPDTKMNQFLRRLGAEDTTPLAGTPYEKTENLLKRLERDGYVFKIREASGTGEDDIYWVVGPRGKVEVGDEAVAGLARTVYNADEMEDEDREELERRVERSLGMAEKVAQMEKESQRAQAAAVEKEKKKRGRRRRDDDEDEEGEEYEI